MYIFFKNLITVLYKYYNQGGTKSTTYYCAISGLLIVLYLNFITLLSLFKFDDFVGSVRFYSKPIKYLIFFFLLLPFFLFLKKTYKEEDIKNYKPSINYKVSISLFFIYLMISLIMFVVVIKK